MKKFIASFLIIVGCALIFSGCTTTDPNPPQQVDKNVLLITETVACAGSAYYVQQKPQDVPQIVAARNALTVLVTQSNVSPAQLTAALAPLMNKDSQVWLAPAAVLFANWVHDYTSGNQILSAIRNGLDCGTYAQPDTSGATRAAGAFRASRVDIYKTEDGRYSWRCVAGNGRVVSVWGKASAWKYSAERSAKKQKPGVAIFFYE